MTSVSVPLSPEAVAIIDQLVTFGIYGRSQAEVVCRLVDRALEQFVEPPCLKTRGARSADQPPPPPRLGAKKEAPF